MRIYLVEIVCRDGTFEGPLTDAPTHVLSQIADGHGVPDCAQSDEGETVDEVREQARVVLIARANGWPT